MTFLCAWPTDTQSDVFYLTGVAHHFGETTTPGTTSPSIASLDRGGVDTTTTTSPNSTSHRPVIEFSDVVLVVSTPPLSRQAVKGDVMPGVSGLADVLNDSGEVVQVGLCVCGPNAKGGEGNEA